MSATRTFLLLLLLLALPGAALAQPGSDPQPDPQSDDGRADVEHRIQMMRVFALTEALELDEDTAVRLWHQPGATRGPRQGGSLAGKHGPRSFGHGILEALN